MDWSWDGLGLIMGWSWDGLGLVTGRSRVGLELVMGRLAQNHWDRWTAHLEWLDGVATPMSGGALS